MHGIYNIIAGIPKIAAEQEDKPKVVTQWMAYSDMIVMAFAKIFMCTLTGELIYPSI